MSPIWLLGEAVIPGRKVGTTFKKGKAGLRNAAQEISDVVSTSAKDIVVIVDQRFKETKSEKSADVFRASEVIKAAGDHAILVVTSSLEKATEKLHQQDVGPLIKKALQTHGREVIVLLDSTLKNPVVVTGVARFARTKGIPYPEALIRLASLGVAKILATIPEEAKAGVAKVVEELDATELENNSSEAAREAAKNLGKATEGKAPKVETAPPGTEDPYAKMRKDTSCTIM